MSTEGDFIPDTYRTLAQIPDRGRCWECKHARYRMKDGHISLHVGKAEVAEYETFARCGVGEHTKKTLCVITGDYTEDEKERDECLLKNPAGECCIFERVTAADLAPANIWLRIPRQVRTMEGIGITAGIAVVTFFVLVSIL